MPGGKCGFAMMYQRTAVHSSPCHDRVELKVPAKYSGGFVQGYAGASAIAVSQQ
jgi:hypothetical protein